MTKPYTMTVRDFKDRIVDQIKNLPDDSEIFFGAGDLSFYRVKNRGYIGDSDMPRLVQIEFNQVYVVDIDPEQPD
ncbi:hypothetical protein [Burkholderia cepacia]|uniref:hypothetical protein n=1 Tax=Burkholderia cepacia TaxID=292 RepID=UPI000759D589|nr:hypothetical protein [Burkholderia cepacia]KVX53349.1 hypothetical protein WL06_16360 [Burkholderia cepacia]